MFDIKRREFISLLGGAAAWISWPSTARAQQSAKVWKVGFLGAESAATNQHFFDAFREGMRDHAYIDGKNIIFVERWAEGRSERFPELIDELNSPKGRRHFGGKRIPSRKASKKCWFVAADSAPKNPTFQTFADCWARAVGGPRNPSRRAAEQTDELATFYVERGFPSQRRSGPRGRLANLGSRSAGPQLDATRRLQFRAFAPSDFGPGLIVGAQS